MFNDVKQIAYLLLAFFSVGFLSSCEEENQELNRQNKKGTIAFSFDKKSIAQARLSQASEEARPASIVISVKDGEGNYILNAKKLELISLGEGYFTENIAFAEGTYFIEDFLVIDSLDAALYLTPKLGSAFEDLVAKPLPYAFDVAAQRTSQVSLEVIPSNLGEPNKYGYGVFSFDVVNTLEKGLVLHLPFDGNANDVSKTGNHGVANGALLTYDRNGIENSAYFFDGIDDNIIFGYDSSFSKLEMSFSFWVNFDEFNSAVIGNDIVDNHQSGVWFSIGQTVETQNRIALNYGNGGGPVSSSRKSFVAEDPLKPNQWYHIVGIITEHDSMSVFINGVEANGIYSGSATTYHHSKGTGSIGRVWDPGSFFSGKMDDLRIYSRALMQQEINKLYTE